MLFRRKTNAAACVKVPTRLATCTYYDLRWWSFENLFSTLQTLPAKLLFDSRTSLDAPIELREHASFSLNYILEQCANVRSIHGRSNFGLKVSETFNKQHCARGTRTAACMYYHYTGQAYCIYFLVPALYDIMRTIGYFVFTRNRLKSVSAYCGVSRAYVATRIWTKFETEIGDIDIRK